MRTSTVVRTISFALALAPAPLACAAGDAPTRVDDILARLNDPTAPGVLVGAHRGDWRRAPENSLRAMRNCIDMRLDIVELDVRRTKDGAFIVFHDKTLDRTTTGTGRVDAHTLAEIRELHLTNPHTAATRERVPTLEEALELCKDKILVFIDKGEPYIEEIAPILRRTGTTRQVIFFGTYTEPEARAHFGDLYDDIIYVPKIFPSTHDLASYTDSFLTAAERPEMFAVWYDSDQAASVPMIDRIREGGSRVWVSTLWPDMCASHDDDLAIDDPDAHWGVVIATGATVLLTDRPVAMLEYLESKGLRPTTTTASR